MRKGKIVYHKAFGKSVVQPEERDTRLDTIYDLASLTKVVATTPLVLKLVEDSEISLSDPVCLHIPEFKGRGRERITIWHLLTHTSGLPSWIPFYAMCKSREEVYKMVLCSDLARPIRPPGEKIVYSDLGFMILGLLIEKKRGERLDRIAQSELFIPLGMKDTMYNPPPELKERIAATEYCKFRQRIVWGEVHDENAYVMGGVSGHAGLFSTSYDLALYAQMLLNKGILGEKRILSPSSIALMTREQFRDSEDRRALGWTMRLEGKYSSGGDLLSDEAFGHTGFTGTSLWIDPKLDLAVIFLTNRVHYGRENTAILRDRARLHNIIVSSIVE